MIPRSHKIIAAIIGVVLAGWVVAIGWALADYLNRVHL